MRKNIRKSPAEVTAQSVCVGLFEAHSILHDETLDFEPI